MATPEKNLHPITGHFKRPIVWRMVLKVAVLHALAIWALYPLIFVVSWAHIAYATLLALASIQGVTTGAHRYYSHRSFKASVPLQIILTILQTTSTQDPVWNWVRNHRQHHKYSDTDADMHNASDGFFFSHIGWIMSRKLPIVIEKGKGIDTSDLDSDSIVMFQKKYYVQLWWFFNFLLIIFPIYVLGESLGNALLVSVVLRTTIVLHCTFSINSWAHHFGTKPYDRNIRPVEQVMVSILCSGEGWHNYHHTFPWDYRASDFGAPFNISANVIDLCAYFGWATDLKTATPETIKMRALRSGEGTPLKNKFV